MVKISSVRPVYCAVLCGARVGLDNGPGVRIYESLVAGVPAPGGRVFRLARGSMLHMKMTFRQEDLLQEFMAGWEAGDDLTMSRLTMFEQAQCSRGLMTACLACFPGTVY